MIISYATFPDRTFIVSPQIEPPNFIGAWYWQDVIDPYTNIYGQTTRDIRYGINSVREEPRDLVTGWWA